MTHYHTAISDSFLILYPFYRTWWNWNFFNFWLHWAACYCIKDWNVEKSWICEIVSGYNI